MSCQCCLTPTVCLFLLTILPCVVRAQDYQLEVVLRSYRNPFNQRSSGHCCDPHTSYPVACNGQGCDSECDPYFAMNATYSTVNHTTSYIDTEQTDFPNSSVYMFYGESSLWLNNQLTLSIVVYDQSDIQHIILNSSFSIEAAENCLFHNMSMRKEHNIMACNSFVELNISYRVIEIHSSCCQDTSITDQVIGVEFCSLHELCGENGHCQENGGYICQCDDGYSGVHCEHIDFCVVYSPCQNAGNCSMIHAISSNVDWYTCTCSENWTGLNCDVSTTTLIRNVVTSVYITVPMSCSAILSSTSQPYNVTSIVISGTITSQPESREIIPRATPVTSHTSSSYYSCIEPSPPQPNNTPQLQVVYSSLFIGGFLAGLSLAGIIFISFVTYLKMKARKKVSKTRPQYFSRRERNPFYQSAEDITRGVPTNTPQQYTDFPEYDTLRNLPLACGSGKLLPLHNKENGSFYCLSPTDQPSPLRPVPNIQNRREQSPQYETITFKLQGQPHNLMQEYRAQETTKCTRNINSNSSKCPPQYKNFPIYEMANLHVYQNESYRQAAVVMPSTRPPALPQRRNTVNETDMNTNSESGQPLNSQNHSKHQTTSKAGPREGVQGTCAIDTEQQISVKEEQLITTSKRESREEGEKKELVIEAASNEMSCGGGGGGDGGGGGGGGGDGVISTDIEALYTKVVKTKSRKCTKTVSEHSSDDDYAPSIPPYCEAREEEEEETTLNSNGSDGGDGDQEIRPSTLFIF